MHPGKGGHRDELWFSSYYTGVCWVVRVLNMTYTGVRFSFTSWLRRCLPGFSTAKLKHLFFFFFVLNPCMFWVADSWHSFWLSHSLNSFPIIRNFLPWEFLLGRGSRLKCVSTLLEVRVRNSCGRSQRHSVSRQWGRCHVDPTSEETAEI